MTTAVFKGFDITALRNTAAAQPVGQQKAKFSADVAAQLGTNPIMEVRIGPTVVYRSAVAGTLTSSASGVPFPTQFTEPPSVNVANALTDPACVIVLKHATNSSIEVQVPLKVTPGVPASFLTASAALDGTKAVRTNGVLLVPPSVLDVAVGGGGGGGGNSPPPTGYPTITRADIVNQMTTASVSQPRFGDSSNAQAAIQAANYRNVKRYVDQGPTTAFKFYDYFDEILPWFWPYAGPGHNDSLNLRLQYTSGVISVKRASTGQWVNGPVSSGTSFDGEVWYGNAPQRNYYISELGDIRDHADGSRSSQLKGTTGVELWFPKTLNRQLMLDCAEVACICIARVIDNNNQPYYGAGANYVAKLGFDFWGRGAPGGYYQDATNNRYWGKAANGSNSKFISFTNGDWKPCAVITCDGYNKTPGNAHTGDYNSTPDAIFPPYVLTPAAVTAGDHPSWVIP